MLAHNENLNYWYSKIIMVQHYAIVKKHTKQRRKISLLFVSPKYEIEILNWRSYERSRMIQVQYSPKWNVKLWSIKDGNGVEMFGRHVVVLIWWERRIIPISNSLSNERKKFYHFVLLRCFIPVKTFLK